MSDDKLPPTNMRRYRRESDRKFLYLVIFTLVVVGGGLIALIYGAGALLTALPCLLAGAALILVPWLLLTAAEKWRDRMEREEWAALDLTNRPDGDMMGDSDETAYPRR
jgi:membrane protein implicated in regulation of membrane protease activity